MAERRQRTSLTEPMLPRLDNPLAPYVDYKKDRHAKPGRLFDLVALPDGTVLEKYV